MWTIWKQGTQGGDPGTQGVRASQGAVRGREGASEGVRPGTQRVGLLTITLPGGIVGIGVDRVYSGVEGRGPMEDSERFSKAITCRLFSLGRSPSRHPPAKPHPFAGKYPSGRYTPKPYRPFQFSLKTLCLLMLCWVLALSGFYTVSLLTGRPTEDDYVLIGLLILGILELIF